MLASIGSTLVIIIGFGVLIFVHELGHFLAAKWAGIRTEAFAVGMGPVAVSWRKGVGFAAGSTDAKVRAKAGRSARELSDEGLAAHGLGETEYSLRWLPIGGFVKMLGQEDANPGAVSNDPRSYTECPIYKRMIVVSAGVVMNVLLAMVIFVITFTVGVELEAPIIGEVRPGSPAATAVATNAESAGVTEPGLQPGDRVRTADGDDVRTFADVTIATAMGRLDEPVRLDVQRPGVDAELQFAITPVKSGGMLQIGIAPSLSTTLESGSATVDEQVLAHLERIVPGSGLKPAATMIAVNETAIDFFGDGLRAIAAADGAPVDSTWRLPDGSTTAVLMQPERGLVTQRSADPDDDQKSRLDSGALGLTPLVKVRYLADNSPNREILQPGDIIIAAGELEYPSFGVFRGWASGHADSTQPIVVLRDGARIELDATIGENGQLGFFTATARELNLIATPIARVIDGIDDEGSVTGQTATAVAALDLPSGTRVEAIGDQPTPTWNAIMRTLYRAAEGVVENDADRELALHVVLPVNDASGAPLREVHAVTLTTAHAQQIVDAGWTSPMHDMAAVGDLLRPGYVVEKGETFGESIAMGFHETANLVYLTYLTIDRLVRGTVGIDQLRGPVGIIDLGTQVLPRGFMYFLLLLGMISVNLAVINFLPLPIVDGGLFLFLVYEKFKGRPPSIAFQNAATLVGLLLIGTLFVVTLYNDVARWLL